MTETTEEKEQISDMINRDLRGAIQHLKDTGCDGVSIATLENCFSYYKAQVSSLTKERDEQNKEICRLIASIGELSYPYSYCRCEGQFEELDLSSDQTGDYTSSCKSCGLEVNEDEENSVVELKAVDYAALKSQLSNRDKEIEKLKQNIRNFINEGEGFCPDCLDRALKDPEVDNDILRAQKSALQIHRNIKKRQDKKIESYENFKDSVLRSIKDCREIEPGLADCFENTCGIHELLASLNKEGEEE